MLGGVGGWNHSKFEKKGFYLHHVQHKGAEGADLAA